MKKLKTMWFWLAAVPATCSGACGTLPPAPVTPPAAYSCATFCANALRLECSFAQPAPGNNATCEDVCRSATSVVRWDLTCRSTSQTCELIDACERGGGT
jgi:hypothetical protein